MRMNYFNVTLGGVRVVCFNQSGLENQNREKAPSGNRSRRRQNKCFIYLCLHIGVSVSTYEGLITTSIHIRNVTAHKAAQTDGR